jgi:hypothetical protein
MNRIRSVKIIFSGLILLLLAFSLPVSSQEGELPCISIEKIPSTLEEFITLRDELALTPQGGATMLIIACIMYTRDSELGEQCLVIALAHDLLVKGSTYKGYALSFKAKKFIQECIGKDSGKAYIPCSYIKGTGPENGYRLPDGKLVFEYSYNQFSGDMEQGVFKVFVRCTGADSPRPVTLTRNDKGIWKAYAWHSLLVTVKPPLFKDDL